MEEQFYSNKEFKLNSAMVEEVCPSNIALIKYWGKKELQIPLNPSISYTLKESFTRTEISFNPDKPFTVETLLAGEVQIDFAKKIEKYFKNLVPYLPWITSGEYIIRTENTFPHSSGIASSASGFGAIAKCLMELDAIFSGPLEKDFKERKTSFLARLGSGSASRSIYPGLVTWGKVSEIPQTSDLYATRYPDEKIHPVFRDFNDWILLIHEGKKSVGSTLGHKLMETNPYAEERFRQAKLNFKPMIEILASGDMDAFIKLVEHEALSLHAMMLMSEPPFILMNEGTLGAIHRIWSYREETKNPVFFTLDAGANMHVLFPSGEKEDEIKEFIEKELLPFTQNGKIVKDRMKF